MQYIRFAKITYSDLLYIFFSEIELEVIFREVIIKQILRGTKAFSIAEFGNFRELISHDHRIYPQRVK